MYIDEICPNCNSSDKVYLVSGGYLCESCEARLIMKDLKLIEVTDFISKKRMYKYSDNLIKMIKNSHFTEEDLKRWFGK